MRRDGVLVDLPAAVAVPAQLAGLVPFERNVAFLAGLDQDRLVPPTSFFQLTRVRNARKARTRAASHRPRGRAGVPEAGMSSVREHGGSLAQPSGRNRRTPRTSVTSRYIHRRTCPWMPSTSARRWRCSPTCSPPPRAARPIRRPRGPGYALTYPPHRALLDTPRRQEHAVDPDDRIDVLQEAIDYLARAGELLRPLGDPFLGAYVTRQPEDHSRRSTWPNALTARSYCSSVIPTVSTRSRRTRPPPGGALSRTSQETPHGAGSRWAAGLSHSAVTRQQTRPKAPTPRRETQLNHPNARSCR